MKHSPKNTPLSLYHMVIFFVWLFVCYFLKETKYSQSSLYGHPVDTDTSLVTDSVLCPWGKKALTLSLIIQPTLYKHPVNMDTFHGPLVSVSIGFHCNTFLLFYFPNPLAKYEFYHYRNWSIQSKSVCFGWLHETQFQSHIKACSNYHNIFSTFSHNIFKANWQPTSTLLWDVATV